MSVPKNKLTEVVSLVNGFNEVTHNYLRQEIKFNLWFTLICPTKDRIKSILREVKTRSGIRKIISLPSIKAIKVKAIFKPH